MNERQLLDLFREKKALLEGHFLLSSGLHSDLYFQSALLLQYPPIAEELGRLIAEKISERADVVVSPALGGLIIGQEVARAKKCRAIFTERENGKMSLRRGFKISSQEKILLIEDVITTGGSSKEVMTVVKSFQGEVVAVGALVNRSEGKSPFDVPLHSLLHLPVKTYPAERCIWCKEGLLLVKPGSKTKNIG